MGIQGVVPSVNVRVLLLHLDGSLPNLALMRIAAHHRAVGDTVEVRRADNKGSLAKALRAGFGQIEPRLGDVPFDRVYGSLIFDRTRPLALRARALYPNIILGGTGWDFDGGVQLHNTKLSDHGMDDDGPLDYSIYPRTSDLRDGRAASLGFTQRGCRLSCSHCVVPGKEGKVVAVATIAKIWRGAPWPREILLLDNDFFGNPHWKAIVDELVDGEFKVCFNQGINARMLNDETATAIARLNYRDDSMKHRRIYTAWDGRKDERTLFRGLEALARAGVKPDHIMVYMLIGHAPGETHTDRDYRRLKLREFGARPYPMPFKRSDELVAFQHWIVGAYDKRIPWSEFWGRAKGEPRNLGDRRVSLPLFPEDE